MFECPTCHKDSLRRLCIKLNDFVPVPDSDDASLLLSSLSSHQRTNLHNSISPMTNDINELSIKGRQLSIFYPYGLITPGTIFAHARRSSTRKRLIDALRLSPTDDVDLWRREVI